MVSKATLLLLVVLPFAYCRVYDKCTLARELLNEYHLPRWQIPTWICIVEHESRYNTAARNTQTNDHGLFQISQLFWCDPPAHPQGCGVTCDSLRDDDIHDDVKCVKKIFDEWQRMKGNGFKAWTTYDAYCGGNNEGYINGCGI
ncbi:alpha-lactalbumin-like [Diabrotica virgifera virgifera]|uniref:lysozyme n=1 Tax=Diabrotica virgifera virgifera TaxID=50390 RepID=A0ABM5JVP3_DIAVI|nr:alpha-lactalbumin-like [Diabrotica virgifera virgifera]